MEMMNKFHRKSSKFILHIGFCLLSYLSHHSFLHLCPEEITRKQWNGRQWMEGCRSNKLGTQGFPPTKKLMLHSIPAYLLPGHLYQAVQHN